METDLRRPVASAKPVDKQPFNLTRWFSILSLISIALISLLSAFFLARYLKSAMLERDAVVTMQFVQGVAQSQNTLAYFRDPDRGSGAFEEFLSRIVSMPEVERVNVYSSDLTVIWSDQPGFIGQKFSINPELEAALAGRLALNTGASGKPQKPEHVFEREVEFFAEIYIPIFSANGPEVLGAVEVYKVPTGLFHAIQDGQRLVWLGAVGGGAFLYACLFWVIRRADRIMRRQQSRLVDSERMAAVGEMSAAVAHSIRNPLASIRSTAEVALEEPDTAFLRRSAQDIIAEADKLDKLIREMLSYSRPIGDSLAPVAINALLRDVVHGYAREMEKHHIHTSEDLDAADPSVLGDGLLLAQLLNNLVANALDAMSEGGVLKTISRVEGQGRELEIQVLDTGKGMSPEQMEKVFKPLFTTKPKGMGMGLTLSRMIVERHGGRLSFSSQEGRGTTVTITLPMTPR